MTTLNENAENALQECEDHAADGAIEQLTSLLQVVHARVHHGKTPVIVSIVPCCE